MSDAHMQQEQRALQSFVHLHAHKSKNAPFERGVLLAQYSEAGIALDTPLIFYDQSDVIQAFLSLNFASSSPKKSHTSSLSCQSMFIILLMHTS